MTQIFSHIHQWFVLFCVQWVSTSYSRDCSSFFMLLPLWASLPVYCSHISVNAIWISSVMLGLIALHENCSMYVQNINPEEDWYSPYTQQLNTNHWSLCGCELLMLFIECLPGISVVWWLWSAHWPFQSCLDLMLCDLHTMGDELLQLVFWGTDCRVVICRWAPPFCSFFFPVGWFEFWQFCSNFWLTWKNVSV